MNLFFSNLWKFIKKVVNRSKKWHFVGNFKYKLKSENIDAMDVEDRPGTKEGSLLAVSEPTSMVLLSLYQLKFSKIMDEEFTNKYKDINLQELKISDLLLDLPEEELEKLLPPNMQPIDFQRTIEKFIDFSQKSKRNQENHKKAIELLNKITSNKTKLVNASKERNSRQFSKYSKEQLNIYEKSVAGFATTAENITSGFSWFFFRTDLDDSIFESVNSAINAVENVNYKRLVLINAFILKYSSLSKRWDIKRMGKEMKRFYGEQKEIVEKTMNVWALLSKLIMSLNFPLIDDLGIENLEKIEYKKYKGKFTHYDDLFIILDEIKQAEEELEVFVNEKGLNLTMNEFNKTFSKDAGRLWDDIISLEFQEELGSEV